MGVTASPTDRNTECLLAKAAKAGEVFLVACLSYSAFALESFWLAFLSDVSNTEEYGYQMFAL